MALASVALALGFSGPPSALMASGPLRLARAAMLAAPVAEEALPSFVQTEMRGAAMALHTKQQAPREGKAPEKRPEQAPVQKWQPGRAEYLQFLVDSRHVCAPDGPNHGAIQCAPGAVGVDLIVLLAGVDGGYHT
jgi:hypothetical protein